MSLKSQSSEREEQTFCSPGHPSTLLQELQRLRGEGSLCDVTLRVVDCCLQAHKVVLAAASPFFAAMFSSGMRESGSRVIELRNVDSSAVKSLIEFAYSSQISISYANAPMLIAASDMLQFTEVKQACCDYLQCCIDSANCLDLLQFADTHSCSTLHRAARLHCNLHFSAVTELPAFLEMTLGGLECYLSSDYLRMEGEDTVLEAALRWLDYDQESRSPCAPRVIRTVRMTLLPPSVLLERVWTHRLVSASPECMEVVRRALVEYLSPSGSRSAHAQVRMLRSLLVICICVESRQ